MKRKLTYIAAMLAITLIAFAVWNWSFRIAGVLHCDSAIIDALSVIILGMSFYPAGKVTEKEEAAA